MDPAPNSSLTPQAAGRSKWRGLLTTARRLPWLTLALAVALVAKFQTCDEPKASCRKDWRTMDDEVAVIVCAEQYQRHRDPQVGAILADSMRRVKDFDGAKQLARQLLETTAQADARSVLGKIASTDNQFEEARLQLQKAGELHEHGAQWREAAKDFLALARIFVERQQFLAAVEALARCIHLARQAGSPELEADAHFGASRTLLELGNAADSWAELQRGKAMSSPAKARDYEADFYQETGQHYQAAKLFEAGLAGLAPQRASEHYLNLAYSLIATDRLDEADRYVQQAKINDTARKLVASLASIEGLLLWKRGELARADELFATAIEEAEADEPNDKAVLAIDRAQLALDRGDPAKAAEHAHQAVAWTDEVLAKQTPHYRSWITERHRRGHELLFLALARAGRAEEALLALDHWRSRDVLDSLTPASPPPTEAELQGASSDIRTFTAASASLRSSPLTGRIALTELRQRLAGVDLVALVVAGEELWRLTSHAGALRLDRLGALTSPPPGERLPTELAGQLDAFVADPLERSGAKGTAAALGALLIPAELAVASERALHVVLDPRLELLPMAALRFAGAPLIALRPLVRAVRPAESTCAEPLGPAPRVVALADAVGDLPQTAREAEKMARALGAQLQRGPKATRAALRAPAELLLVAVHADLEAGGGIPQQEFSSPAPIAITHRGGFLKLHDGRARALDISTGGQAPALVMLFACRSAVAEQGNHSLATAYLAAGAHQVVATLRLVSDAGAAAVLARFYEQGGARDPASALARAQAALAATDNRDWPSFAVFGRQTCRAGKRSEK